MINNMAMMWVYSGVIVAFMLEVLWPSTTPTLVSSLSVYPFAEISKR